MTAPAAVAIQVRDVHPVDEESVLVRAAVDRRGRLQERFRPADVHLAQDDARNDARDRPDVDRFGRLSSTSRESTVCCSADVVSSSGAPPVTVMSSDNVPISSSEVRPGCRVGVDDDVLLAGRSEPGELALHGVDAGHEPDELKRAALVGHGVLIAADAAARIGEGDGHARQHRPGAVRDRAADRSNALRVNMTWECEPHKQQDDKHRQERNLSEGARAHHPPPLLGIPRFRA